jgi:hypothetical protein
VTIVVLSTDKMVQDVTHLMLLRAISIEFCKLGSPVGSSLCRSVIDFSTSCGFPVNAPILSPIPALIPTTPICPSGFWSNHSVTNSLAYCNIRSNRVGRMSRSIIAADKSSSKIKCRIIVRRMAVEGASNLGVYEKRWDMDGR